MRRQKNFDGDLSFSKKKNVWERDIVIDSGTLVGRNVMDEGEFSWLW